MSELIKTLLDKQEIFIKDSTCYLPIKGVCNINCLFCNIYELKEKENYEDHFLYLKKILDELDNKKLQNIMWGIHGYEPTEFIYLDKILEYSYNKGYKNILVTNGVKLKDKSYLSTISKYINEVIITLFAANDEENHFYTQSKISYKDKYLAIENCIEQNIHTQVSVLLMPNNLYSLDKIIFKLNEYCGNYSFNNKITITVPSILTLYDRVSFLFPTYSSVANQITKVIGSYSGKIKFSITGIPYCFFEDKFIENGNNVGIEYNVESSTLSKFNCEYTKFDKCKTCSKYNICNGVSNIYIKQYGSKEFTENKSIDNNLSLHEAENKLQLLIQEYENNKKRGKVGINTDVDYNNSDLGYMSLNEFKENMGENDILYNADKIGFDINGIKYDSENKLYWLLINAKSSEYKIYIGKNLEYGYKKTINGYSIGFEGSNLDDNLKILLEKLFNFINK